jgi:hypothetical protein
MHVGLMYEHTAPICVYITMDIETGSFTSIRRPRAQYASYDMIEAKYVWLTTVGEKANGKIPLRSTK